MHVGKAIVARARALGVASIAVVGTAKNVGKTVTVTAVVDALASEGKIYGIASIGRDGERLDTVEGTQKPRISLAPGALLATARASLPAHPALEFLEATGMASALGEVVIARVRAPGDFEVAGPAAASGLRHVVARLSAHGAHCVAIDGAVDRLAALREEDAVVLAVGAAAGPTPARIAAAAAQLVATLGTPRFDAGTAYVEVAGALTAAKAAQLARSAEGRQVVVEDPTKIVAGGLLGPSPLGLNVRVRHPLRVVACTVASIGPERSFEPHALLEAVAAATGIPCYDVYAGAAA